MRQADETRKAGPLAGLTVIEMAGLGPVPLAGLILADLGADVLSIERMAAAKPFIDIPPAFDLNRHGRQVVKVDLKREEGTRFLKHLIANADVLIEGFRPGVMERLGLGPEAAQEQNGRLVYGRMTGFGQEGPLAERAGHDLTYLAYSGILSMIGAKGGKPLPPLNLVADYGGGTMFLIMGILAALFERSFSGRGQIVDAAMIDGVSTLAAPYFGFLASGFWKAERGANLLDAGAPFYDTYETAGGGHVAVACLEPQFFAEFARLLPLDERFANGQYDKELWEDMRAAIAKAVKAKARDEWVAIFQDTDACVAPVLSVGEAVDHPHNRARGTHDRVGKLDRPTPAPRFSRTPGAASGPATPALDLSRFGVDEEEALALKRQGVIQT